MVDVLLKQDNLNINVLAEGYGTPLMMAVNQVNLEVFELLLNDHRIDILQCDEKRNSIFHLALKVGAISIVQILLNFFDEKINEDGELVRDFVNLENKFGNTILH